MSLREPTASCGAQRPPPLHDILGRHSVARTVPEPAVSLTMALFRDPRVVIETTDGGTLRVPLENVTVSMSHGGEGLDEDFEPVEREAGKFIEFECYGDPRVRRFFQQRAIIDGKTLAPREHTWTIEHGKEGAHEPITFAGRLYDRHTETINPLKAFRIRGRIRVSDGDAPGAGITVRPEADGSRPSARRLTEPGERGLAASQFSPLLPVPDGINPDIVLLDDVYFVVRVPDNVTLHVLVTNSSFQNRLKRRPETDNPLPTDGVGYYYHFRCFGDYKAHSYFSDRDTPQNNEPHTDDEWKIEYAGRDDVPHQCRFKGTLYGYRHYEMSEGKWAFLGIIKVSEDGN